MHPFLAWLACLFCAAPAQDPASEREAQVAQWMAQLAEGGPGAVPAAQRLGFFGADAAVAVPRLRAAVAAVDGDPSLRAAAVASLLKIGDDLDDLRLLHGLEGPAQVDAALGVMVYAAETGGTFFGAEPPVDALVEFLAAAVQELPAGHPRTRDLMAGTAWLAGNALEDEHAALLEEALLAAGARDPDGAGAISRTLRDRHPATGAALPDDPRRIAVVRLRGEPLALGATGGDGMRVVSVTHRPALRWLPGSQAESTFHVRDLATGEAQVRVSAGGSGRHCAALRDEGSSALVAGGILDGGAPALLDIDLDRGVLRRTLPLPARPLCSAVAARGAVFLAACYSELYALDLAGDEPRAVRIGRDHKGHGLVLKVLPDARRLVVPALDHAIEVRDVAGGQVVERLLGHESTVLAADAVLDRILSGDRNGELILWDARALAPIRRFEACPSGAWSVALSEDGRLAAAGAGSLGEPGQPPAEGAGTVRVFDVATGVVVARFDTFPDHLRAVAISADGTRVAALGLRHAYLWRIEPGRDE